MEDLASRGLGKWGLGKWREWWNRSYLNIRTLHLAQQIIASAKQSGGPFSAELNRGSQAVAVRYFFTLKKQIQYERWIYHIKPSRFDSVDYRKHDLLGT